MAKAVEQEDAKNSARGDEREPRRTKPTTDQVAEAVFVPLVAKVLINKYPTVRWLDPAFILKLLLHFWRVSAQCRCRVSQS